MTNYLTFEKVYDTLIARALLDKEVFTKAQVVEKLIYQCGFARHFADKTADAVMIELGKC